MCQSSEINELAVALNKVQSQMMNAGKDAKNLFFKSKYATLNSVWEAIKDALLANDLTALQPISNADGRPVVKTIVMHKSGQFITSECPIVCAKQNDPQAMGSAITYARRYSLASMFGVMTDEDDDAEKAMNRPSDRLFLAKESPSARYKKLLEVKNMYTPDLVNKFNTMTYEEKKIEYARVKGL